MTKQTPAKMIQNKFAKMVDACSANHQLTAKTRFVMKATNACHVVKRISVQKKKCVLMVNVLNVMMLGLKRSVQVDWCVSINNVVNVTTVAKIRIVGQWFVTTPATYVGIAKLIMIAILMLNIQENVLAKQKGDVSKYNAEQMNTV